MKILVTGGAGYIGSVLVPMLLQEGHGVRVLDSLRYGGRSMLGSWSHPQFELLKGDLRVAEDVEAAVGGMDAIVHVAAIVGDPACARDPELARAVNLQGSLTLLDRSLRAGARRFIFLSTCSNYGRMADPANYLNESSELHPLSLYAETKVAVEETLLNYSQRDLCATVLRLATIFGVSPRMRFDLTVNEFTHEMVANRRLVVFGEQFWRPYVHVRDAARAIVETLNSTVERVQGQVFNVGSTSQNYQKGQLVELIRPHAPEAIVEYVHREEDPRDYRVSFDKIESALGFTITRTVEDGVAEVARLVRANLVDDLAQAEFRN